MGEYSIQKSKARLSQDIAYIFEIIHYKVSLTQWSSQSQVVLMGKVYLTGQSPA